MKAPAISANRPEANEILQTITDLLFIHPSILIQPRQNDFGESYRLTSGDVAG